MKPPVIRLSCICTADDCTENVKYMFYLSDWLLVDFLNHTDGSYNDRIRIIKIPLVKCQYKVKCLQHQNLSLVNNHTELLELDGGHTNNNKKASSIC